MRIKIATELKKGYEKLLTENATKTIDNLIKYTKSIKSKMWLLFNKNFRTNNFKINVKMIIAIILNKF